MLPQIDLWLSALSLQQVLTTRVAWLDFDLALLPVPGEDLREKVEQGRPIFQPGHIVLQSLWKFPGSPLNL